MPCPVVTASAAYPSNGPARADTDSEQSSSAPTEQLTPPTGLRPTRTTVNPPHHRINELPVYLNSPCPRLAQATLAARLADPTKPLLWFTAGSGS